MFCKKGVFRNFAKLTGKHLYQSLFFFFFRDSGTVCSIVYFHTVISVFCSSIYVVFVTDRNRKQMLLIKLFDFVFTKDLPSISQSKQYTLSNMMYVKLPKIVAFFSLRSVLCFEAPNMYANRLKNICDGVFFFAFCFCSSFTKNMLLYKYFSRLLLRFVL